MLSFLLLMKRTKEMINMVGKRGEGSKRGPGPFVPKR